VAGSEVPDSFEYGVAVLDCPLVVVLGHDSCGAVGAASAALEDGVTPSVLAARAAGRVEPEEILAEHVHQTVDLLLERSRVLADRVDTGQAAVVACATGWPTTGSGFDRRGHSTGRCSREPTCRGPA
jgi:carbonic anhydrase